MQRLRFVRHEHGKDVYFDSRAGTEVFLGRPQVAGDAEQAITTRLRAVFFEVLDIERELTASGRGRERDLYRRLGELVTWIEETVSGPGQEMPRAYFVRGLILRVLRRFRDAELSFRTANELGPGDLNTLRELVLCLGQQGLDAEAVSFARAAVNVAPEDTGALGNLASALARSGGSSEEGLRAIERALEIDPNDEINRRIFERFYRS